MGEIARSNSRIASDLKREIRGPKYLGWHVCRTKLARKIFFGARIFSRKMLRNFPRNFRAFILRARKNPQNSRQTSCQISLPKIKKNSPTSFCRSAGRTNTLAISIVIRNERLATRSSTVPICQNCEKGCDLSLGSKIASDWRSCPSKFPLFTEGKRNFAGEWARQYVVELLGQTWAELPQIPRR